MTTPTFLRSRGVSGQRRKSHSYALDRDGDILFMGTLKKHLLKVTDPSSLSCNSATNLFYALKSMDVLRGAVEHVFVRQLYRVVSSVIEVIIESAVSPEVKP